MQFRPLRLEASEFGAHCRIENAIIGSAHFSNRFIQDMQGLPTLSHDQRNITKCSPNEYLSHGKRPNVPETSSYALRSNANRSESEIPLAVCAPTTSRRTLYRAIGASFPTAVSALRINVFCFDYRVIIQKLANQFMPRYSFRWRNFDEPSIKFDGSCPVVIAIGKRKPVVRLTDCVEDGGRNRRGVVA
jgi:hypothetical protein